jgi:hypothetical protein
MKNMLYLFLVLALAVTTLAPTNALAQSPWEPFDGVSKLVEWFANLNAKFDKIVIAEKQGQLLRSVDRLRKELYSLEADTQILLDNIPDKAPNAEQNEQLKGLSDVLMITVERLGHSAREIGADLRLNEGIDVEHALTYGLGTRRKALTYLQQALNEAAARPWAWNAQEVRARLDKGLQAIRTAQVAVTMFRQKLASSK